MTHYNFINKILNNHKIYAKNEFLSTVWKTAGNQI
jgi:hypothetical protein